MVGRGSEIALLKRCLDSNESEFVAVYGRRRGTKGPRGRQGCQIDLLIQARRTIYIVEVKRKREIGRDVISEVDRKVRSIRRPPDVSVRTALVYDGNLSPVAKADG